MWAVLPLLAVPVLLHTAAVAVLVTGRLQGDAAIMPVQDQARRRRSFRRNRSHDATTSVRPPRGSQDDNAARGSGLDTTRSGRAMRNPG